MRYLLTGLLIFLGTAVLSGTKDNELNISHKSGEFTGKAGVGWTDSQLKKNAFGALCPDGQKVAELHIARDSKGVAKFTGKCVKLAGCAWAGMRQN